MLRIRAGSVHPVTAPPISDGAVLIDGGRIAAVGPHRDVPALAGSQSLEFPQAVLVPGLVNCHTHLELTHLAGRVAETDFPAWIRRVRALKDETAPAAFRGAAEGGVRACWAQGVTCVADTGSTGAAAAALAALGGRGIVYQEVFGPDPAVCEASLAGLVAAVEGLSAFVSDRVRVGVSPHAPYTVSAPLYRAVAQFARRHDLPLAVHLAESRAESDLVRDGSGPFADALRSRGIAVEARGMSPVQYLVQLGVVERGTPCLCIHCVQVSHGDVDLLKEAGATIAHCPRSNRAHDHGTAPLAALRAAGIAVGLGTDSVVSTGDVSVWEESHAAGFEGEDALRMLTIEGARALGWDSAIGSLEIGKQADLAVFDRLTAAFPDRPTALLTVVAGRPVHRYIGAP